MKFKTKVGNTLYQVELWKYKFKLPGDLNSVDSKETLYLVL